MRSLDIMLTRPGVYLVEAGPVCNLVEVDAEGRCFQLEPHSGQYRRDGELKPGGWNPLAITNIQGPFQRPQ